MRQRALPWLLLLLLATVMFALACRLVPAAFSDGNPGHSSTAGRFFASSRMGLGAAAIQRADLYLHRGLEAAPPEAFSNTWFQWMGAQVSVSSVAHREGDATREVVPWLWFAASMDPDNTDYTLMSIYWLKVAGRDELAMRALRDALGRHPRSPQLHLERARLLLRGGDIAGAARALDAGLACTSGGLDGSTNVVRGMLCTYRSLIYEYDGDTNAAIACLSDGNKQSPDVVRRLAELRSNRPSPVPAAVVLSNLVHVVHHCDDHEGAHEEADEAAEHGRLR